MEFDFDLSTTVSAWTSKTSPPPVWYEHAQNVLRLYGFMTILFGLFGNASILAVEYHNRLSRRTTRFLFSCLAVADALVLCTAQLRYWTRNSFEYDPRHDSPFACKMHLFLVYFSKDCSTWLLCLLSGERLVLTARPMRAGPFLNLQRVTAMVVCLVVTSFAKNGMFLNWQYHNEGYCWRSPNNISMGSVHLGGLQFGSCYSILFLTCVQHFYI